MPGRVRSHDEAGLGVPARVFEIDIVEHEFRADAGGSLEVRQEAYVAL